MSSNGYDILCSIRWFKVRTNHHWLGSPNRLLLRPVISERDENVDRGSETSLRSCCVIQSNLPGVRVRGVPRWKEKPKGWFVWYESPTSKSSPSLGIIQWYLSSPVKVKQTFCRSTSNGQVHDRLKPHAKTKWKWKVQLLWWGYFSQKFENEVRKMLLFLLCMWVGDNSSLCSYLHEFSCILLPFSSFNHVIKCHTAALWVAGRIPGRLCTVFLKSATIRIHSSFFQTPTSAREDSGASRPAYPKYIFLARCLPFWSSLSLLLHLLCWWSLKLSFVSSSS